MGNLFRLEKTLCCAPATICALTLWVTFAQPTNVVASEKLEELAQRVGVRILADATSDRDVLSASKSQIPYAKMSPRSQQRASYILSNLSQYRRMPCLQYEVNPGMYQYLINHPDVGISTWRVMGISKLQMFQTGEFEYEASASDGSKGKADVLWRDANQCLFIVEGTYSSPMLPGAIEASALVWLRYRFVDTKDGKVLVNQQVEAFISFPSYAVDTLARLATMITNTILDRNVFEVSLYARMMSTASRKEPEWIEQVAQRMDGVLPQRRLELVEVSRGRNPNSGNMLPAAVADRQPAISRLPRSGSFRAFEDSLHQVNKHVPLVAGEVRHKPSYGQRIGDSNAAMARPHQYLPPEAQAALAAERERKLRTQHYNQYYANPAAKGVPAVGSPTAVPPSMTASRQGNIEGLMTDLPFLSAPVSSPSGNVHGKSTTGAMPVAPSAPLGKSTASRLKRPSRATSLHAKPVSKSAPLSTDASPSASAMPASALPPQAVTIPPVSETVDSGVK